MLCIKCQSGLIYKEKFCGFCGASVPDTKLTSFPSTYIVYDLETTGLHPMKDEAVEIGALLVREGKESILKTWLLRPSIPVPVESTAVHGISQRDVDRFGHDPDECWCEFARFTEIDQPVPPYPFVGHNIVGFDNAFTQRAMARLGLSFANVTCIDTAAIFKGRKMKTSLGREESHGAYAKRVLETRAPGLQFNLQLAYIELGGCMEGMRAHGAADDVQMTDFVYRKLAGIS